MPIFRSKRQKSIDSQVQDYFSYCEFKKRMTPSTMKSKKQAVRKFVAEHPNLRDFRSLTNIEMDRWYEKLVSEGKTGKTVNNYADHVIGCLRFLRDQRAAKLRIRLEVLERAQEDPSQAPYFIPAEVERIKAACQGLRELLLVTLIFDSSLRIHEVAKLRVEEVSDGTVELIGKGRRKRTTFIVPGTQKLLQQWLLQTDITTGYVFPSPLKFGDHLSIQSVRQTINGPIHRAGLSAGSAHAIRHASITHDLESGTMVSDVQMRVGHSRSETTLGYYHPDVKRMQKQHEKVFSASAA